jgi:hypothetical protein
MKPVAQSVASLTADWKVRGSIPHSLQKANPVETEFNEIS